MSQAINRRQALTVVAAVPVGAALSTTAIAHHQANRLVHFINEMMPSFLILILVFVVYGLFRTAVSVLRELNGVSLAAHATLYVDYGKK